MNGSDEQEIHGLIRLKHRSHGLKTNVFAKSFPFATNGAVGSKYLPR
jgi:hypothetical protein